MAIISSRPTLALVKTRWRKKGARTLAERGKAVRDVLQQLRGKAQ